MIRSGNGSGSPKPPVKPSGIVDLAAARAQLADDELSALAEKMRREGCAPDQIMGALCDANDRLPIPLEEERLDALVARCIDDYRKGYVPKLKQVEMDGFMRASYPPPKFIVDQLIPRNEVTLASGHGGSGKSFLFLAIAAHVASGEAWDQFDVEQCQVVYITLEDSADRVMWRLQKIVGHCLLDAEAVVSNFKLFDGTASPELMVEVSQYGTRNLMPTPTMKELEQAVVGAGLIIIDNTSDAYGGNENERRSVRTFVRHLAAIARDNNAAIVLISHVDKATARDGGNGNSFSGSTAWHNSARSRVAFVEVEGQWQLVHEKANHSQRAEPVLLTWTEDGVLVPGTSSAVATRVQQAKEDANTALLAMRAAQARGIRVPAAASGNSTSWHALIHMPEMDLFRNADGKRRFHSALLALQEGSMLALLEYRNDQRKTRKAWELTAMGESAAQRLAL